MSIMTHSAETGELVCYAPEDEEILRIIEPDFNKAFNISVAIQKAFRKGGMLARLKFQEDIEEYMQELNKGL